MSLRICMPAKEIIRAAAYADSRAESVSGPKPVTFSTRPPAVTMPPSLVRAVPACVTSTSAGARSKPAIGSPLEEDAG